MNRFTKLLAAAALVAMVAVPARADAQALTSTWTAYGWSAGVGSIIGLPFTLSSTSAMEIWVVDCCVTGDGFELFSGASSLGQTSTALLGTDPDGLFEWGTAGYERGIFSMAAGTYSDLTLEVVRDCCGAGDVYIKAVAVPEPATAMLLVTGTLSLFGMAYRRRDEEVTE